MGRSIKRKRGQRPSPHEVGAVLVHCSVTYRQKKRSVPGVRVIVVVVVVVVFAVVVVVVVVQRASLRCHIYA